MGAPLSGFRALAWEPDESVSLFLWYMCWGRSPLWSDLIQFGRVGYDENDYDGRNFF